MVALDRQGNVAAGTSTGGTTAKRWNRVGDSPIIGAGTYASNQSCAVSATGTGEYFIRLTVARTICALVQYKGKGLQAAADEVVQKDSPPSTATEASSPSRPTAAGLELQHARHVPRKVEGRRHPANQPLSR